MSRCINEKKMRKIEQKWANMYPHFSFSREIHFVKAFILNGYLKLSFCFHHLLPIFSITINTPIPRLRSFTRISLPPNFLFYNAPSTLSGFNWQQNNRLSTGILHCKKHDKYLDDDVEKFCEGSRVHQRKKR